MLNVDDLNIIRAAWVMSCIGNLKVFCFWDIWDVRIQWQKHLVLKVENRNLIFVSNQNARQVRHISQRDDWKKIFEGCECFYYISTGHVEISDLVWIVVHSIIGALIVHCFNLKDTFSFECVKLLTGRIVGHKKLTAQFIDFNIPFNEADWSTEEMFIHLMSIKDTIYNRIGSHIWNLYLSNKRSLFWVREINWIDSWLIAAQYNKIVVY